MSEPNAESNSDSKSHIDEKEPTDVGNDDILPVAQLLTLDEAKAIISESIAGKELDPNFSSELLKRARASLNEKSLTGELAGKLVEELKLEAALLDDSPYLEVRAVVDSTDDPSTPVNTFRAWFLGMIYVTLGTGINTFFSARYPGISVNTFCAQVVAYPMGKFMEWCLPTKKFKTFGYEWSFNPGPWNMKEHMLATIMANVTFGGEIGVYSTDLIFVMRLPQYFNQQSLGANAGWQILLTLSTQLIGFGVAGLTRRFLVYPPSMIWPTNLATIALNRSFYKDKNPSANGWKISRLNFFLVVFFAYGLYFVLPDAVFQALSYFNWTTWIAPKNVKLALITGAVTGLGINPWTTFDYNFLYFDPLITPLHGTLNLYAGMVLLGVPFICIVYFKNIWNTAYLPMNTSGLFDNTGAAYNVSRVLNPDYTLNEAAYAAYSAPYQSAGYASMFFWFFATYTATLVHVALYHYKELRNGFKAVLTRSNPRDAYTDVHNRLMKQYDEVPEWWFGIVLVLSVFGIISNEVYHTQLPVWAVFFGVLLTLIFAIPVGIVMATTNFEITINVVAEIIGGYALPGRPLAVMTFKTYGVVPAAQAVGYAQDLKLGHYMHIAPKTLFWGQLVASVWACFVGVGVADWQIGNIKDLCTPDQVDDFTCANSYAIFFNSAVQWGAIGPARLYSTGRMYGHIMWGFFMGALLPVVFWLLTRKYPTSWWRYVSAPVFLFGGVYWAPGNLAYTTPCLYMAVLFHVYIKRHAVAWWSKYTLILATGLRAAIGIFGVLWFFSILYKDYEPVWWGNTVSFDGCDGDGCPLLPIPDIGYFGPAPVGA